MRIFVFVLIFLGYSIRMIQSQENRDLRINSNQPSYDLTKLSPTKDLAVDLDWLLFFGTDKREFIPINYQNFPSEIHIQETYVKQESSNNSQFIEISRDESQNPLLNGQVQPNVTYTVSSEHLTSDIGSYNSQEADKSQNVKSENKKEPLGLIKETLGYKQTIGYPQNSFSLINNHTSLSQRPTMREVNHLERHHQHHVYLEDKDDPSIQSIQYHHLFQTQRPNFVISSYIAPVQEQNFMPPSSQLISSHENQYQLNSVRDNSQALHSPMNSMSEDKSRQEQTQQKFINHNPNPITSPNDHASYFQNSAIQAYNTPHHSPTSTNGEKPIQEPITLNGDFFINHKQPQFHSSGDYERSSLFQFGVQNAGLGANKQIVDVPQIATDTHNPPKRNDQDSDLGRPTTSNSHSSCSQPLPVNLPENQYPSDHRDPINVAKPSDVGNFKGFQKLTATRPSSKDELAGDMHFPEKPCDVCCKGEEVEPCKSCCNYIPLINVKTFKTILG